MKVIYKKGVIEQIKEEISKARNIGKEIKVIQVSEEEFDKLLDEDANSFITAGWDPKFSTINCYLVGPDGSRSVIYLDVLIQEVKENV